MSRPDRLVTIPNALSVFRLLSVPVLVVLARLGRNDVFLPLLIVSLVTDILDGKIARLLNQQSEFGARLDSWADFATYMTLPVCAWWLVPETVAQEAVFCGLIVASYTLPVAIGFAKFRTLTSYHTRNAVVGAYVLGAAAVFLFAGWSLWPLRVGAVFIAFAELEEIAITVVLSRPVTNVKNLSHALRIKAEGQPVTAGS